MRNGPLLVSIIFGLTLQLATPASAQEADGRFRIDLRVGPSLGLYAPPGYDNSTGLDMQFDFGVRLFAHGEIFFAPGFHYAGQQAVIDPFLGSVTVSLVSGILPIGMRFPFRLGTSGFFLVPKFEFGYAVSASIVEGGDTIYTHFGYFAPALAFEYELHNRWRFLIEPVNLPLFFNGDGAKIAYRVMAGVGVRFGH